MDKEKVLNLAKLARIELGDEEAESLSGEFDAILNYVGEVKGATNDFTPPISGGARPTTDNVTLRNVMREDLAPHESSLYTEKILAQAPSRDGNYIKVKKIL